MIQNDIEQNGYATVVALIDERFEHFRSAVSFVQSQEESRIVSPAIIAVKLVYGHEFNGIDAQAI